MSTQVGVDASIGASLAASVELVPPARLPPAPGHPPVLLPLVPAPPVFRLVPPLFLPPTLAPPTLGPPLAAAPPRVEPPPLFPPAPVPPTPRLTQTVETHVSVPLHVLLVKHAHVTSPVGHPPPAPAEPPPGGIPPLHSTT